MLQAQPRDRRRLIGCPRRLILPSILPAGSTTNLMSSWPARQGSEFKPAEFSGWFAQSLARRLNGEGGRGIGWKIFDAETAGGIRACGKIIARGLAREMIGNARSVFLRTFADDGVHGNLGVGDRFVRFVHDQRPPARRAESGPVFPPMSGANQAVGSDCFQAGAESGLSRQQEARRARNLEFKRAVGVCGDLFFEFQNIRLERISLVTPILHRCAGQGMAGGVGDGAGTLEILARRRYVQKAAARKLIEFRVTRMKWTVLVRAIV